MSLTDNCTSDCPAALARCCCRCCCARSTTSVTACTGSMARNKLRANINCYRGDKHKTTHLTQITRTKKACATIRGRLRRAQSFSRNPPARAFSGRRQAPRNIRRSELISTATRVDNTEKHTSRKLDESKLYVRASEGVWRP